MIGMEHAVDTGAGAMACMLTRYKAWANEITFRAVLELPEGEAERRRQTRFGNILHTLNHVYVIDDIFRAHLEGVEHHYSARNTEMPLPLGILWQAVEKLDRWYKSYARTLTEQAFKEVVSFEFVGGGRGAMTRGEIILHVVNHGTYHRGFVGDMLYQIPATPPANDLTVFLRDANNGGLT